MIIYRIVNLINNKCYIGQTINNFKRRYWGNGSWQIHASNPYLQKAAKKYGVKNFRVELLEENVPNIDELNRLERLYIQKYDCLFPKGYNFKLGGDNKTHHEITKRKIGDARAKDWVFKNNHTGEIIEVHNLSQFCRENNLSDVLMLHVSQGIRKKHKGWSRPETELKSWKIKSPTAEIHVILEGELRAFCREHGLNKFCIDEICKGTWSHHKGWTKA